MTSTRLFTTTLLLRLAPSRRRHVDFVMRAPDHEGNDVPRAMRKKYSGKWYRTLTPSCRPRRSLDDWRSADSAGLWYESLQLLGGPRGGVLRIDNGNPAKGNGSLSSADSTWSVSADTLARTSGSGNPFIPLIENVYLQPVAVTAKQLEPLHFDMTHVVEGSWLGRPAWVVGIASASDTASPQFWIDKEHPLWWFACW